jgi:hypothetical protein
MNNLRGRLGSTRQVRGLGCDTDSSIIWCELHSGLHLAAVIEGSIPFLGLSDLSRSSISERFDARLHGAGINDEENTGQRSMDECHIGRQRFGLSLRTVGATSWSGGVKLKAHAFVCRNHGNPCAEKGMHTRSQQLYFGGGETRHENAETSLIFGEISEVRQPASFSL